MTLKEQDQIERDETANLIRAGRACGYHKIISLKAENVKRLSAVEITPDGNVVIIAGNNGQGKSSVLDSIWYALGGEKSFPVQPVRKGEDKAVITLDLGEYIVTRTITAKGTTSLQVKTPDGKKAPGGGPQTILDGLVGRLTFDPLAFSRMDPDELAQTVRNLVGLDFTEFDAERAKIYDRRTEVGRELLSAQTRLQALRRHADVPATEVSSADILAEQQKAVDANAFNASVRQAANDAQYKFSAAEEKVNLAAKRLEHLNVEIGRLLTEKETLVKEHSDLIDAKLAARKAHEDTTFKCANLLDIPTAPFGERLKTVEDTNRKVRENAQFTELSNKVMETNTVVEALTKELKEMDQSKVDAIAATKFPLPGLGFAEDGTVVYNGVPFSQCSSAEQLRISVAIGLALNPKLRVLLIRDGSLLDTNSLQAVADMAKQADAQVWIERVGKGDEVSVLIEDGKVCESLTK